jgi:6-phosphofructokinase
MDLTSDSVMMTGSHSSSSTDATIGYSSSLGRICETIDESVMGDKNGSGRTGYNAQMLIPVLDDWRDLHRLRPDAREQHRKRDKRKTIVIAAEGTTR